MTKYFRVYHKIFQYIQTLHFYVHMFLPIRLMYQFFLIHLGKDFKKINSTVEGLGNVSLLFKLPSNLDKCRCQAGHQAALTIIADIASPVMQ